jgi:predicted transcriptional regulator of viral defense system
MSVQELAEQLEVEPNAIRAEMSRRKGIFTRLSDNRVALAARDGGTDATY